MAKTKGSKRGGDFVARTIAGMTGALERAVFSDELARRPGLLQTADPRAKVVAILGLLVAAAMVRRLEVLAVLYCLTLLLAWLSRLPLLGFCKRSWLGIPLFAGVVILPSLFLTPGTPVLGPIGAPPVLLAVTDGGLEVAMRFVARVGASVSLALLLVSTTRWTDLLRALRVLRVPETFIVVLGMTYRYLFLFLRGANNLFMARASRTVGAASGAEQRRWAAASAGVLVSRSVKLSGDVLLAMRARGFNGEIRTARDPKMRDEDWLLVAVGVVLAAIFVLIDGYRGLV